MITVFGASNRPDSISDSDVDAVLPMPDGRIWLGLGNKGIDVIDPSSARVASLRPDSERPEAALPKDYINAFAASYDSDVYVGTELGLYRVDRGVRGATRVSIPQRDPTAQVWALLTDLEGWPSWHPGIGAASLDDLLSRLSVLDARQARLVELRFFGGLTEEEAAETLGVSLRTVQKDWRKAKAWLLAELGDGTADDKG